MFCRVLIFITLLFITNCSIVNHYAMRDGNNPVDGQKVNTKKYTDDNVRLYPSGNLDYMNDKEKRNTKKYFASAKYYNDKKYDIANDYLGRYMKQIKIDTDQLEEQIKNGNINTKGSELLDKMEHGDFKVHPLKGNVKFMQWLKDNKDKIAYPDYMADIMDIYIPQTKKKEIKNKDFEDVVIDQSKALASENVRDYYVNYYLAFNDGFAEIEGKQVAFQEKPLT